MCKIKLKIIKINKNFLEACTQSVNKVNKNGRHFYANLCLVRLLYKKIKSSEIDKQNLKSCLGQPKDIQYRLFQNFVEVAKSHN